MEGLEEEVESGAWLWAQMEIRAMGQKPTKSSLARFAPAGPTEGVHTCKNKGSKIQG